MTPVQRRRLFWVLLLLLASGLATTLVAFALQRNIAYLYTPSEGSLEAHFVVTDGDATLPVTTSRILPDMFREDSAVVAMGRLQDGTFIADEVLAKHDENYIPKEVADKMGAAHTKHDVPVPAVETR